MKTVLAEFTSEEAVHEALAALTLPKQRLELYSPHAIEEAPEWLSLPRSWIPRATLIGGLLGAGGAYFILWWCMAVDYPLNVGALPPHDPIAFVPITFETMVLCAGTATFVCFLIAARLLQLWHPVFESESFRGVTRDRYVLAVSGCAVEESRVLASELYRHGAVGIDMVEEQP